jgi:hypothetical protein
MPTSLGTVTFAIVVGGAVDVVARVVATVAGRSWWSALALPVLRRR